MVGLEYYLIRIALLKEKHFQVILQAASERLEGIPDTLIVHKDSLDTLPAWIKEYCKVGIVMEKSFPMGFVGLYPEGKNDG
jgi:hypothetical protein